jgi:shikimate 5-dehydrogenase
VTGLTHTLRWGSARADTPVPAEALSGYACVFDAIYTPLEVRPPARGLCSVETEQQCVTTAEVLGLQTRLLREAKAAGAVPVSGLEMFVGQAAAQFTLFTGAWVGDTRRYRGRQLVGFAHGRSCGAQARRRRWS